MRPRVNSPEPTSAQSALTLLFLAVLSSFALAAKLFEKLAPQDEAVLLLYPDLILRGYTPYADFSAPYPPGNFYLIGAAFYLFGKSILVERVIGVGYQSLMVAAIYLLGSRITWSTGFLAAIATLAVLQHFPAAGAYSIFGALAILLLALLCANRSCGARDAVRQKQWAVLAGLLAGTTCWFRQDVGVVGTLALVAALCPRNVHRLGFFSMGFALPAATMVAFAILAGTSAVFDSLVLDLIRIGPGRQLPVQLSPGLVGLAVGIVANVAMAFTIRGAIAPEHLVWLVRGIAVLSVGLLPSALQRADNWHITYVGSVVAGLAVVSLGIFLAHLDGHTGLSKSGLAKRALAKSDTAFLVAALVAVLGVAFTRSTNEHREKPLRIVSADRWVFANDGLFPGDRSSTSDANSVVSEINRVALPGDKLFVGPRDLRFSNYNDVFFYFLLADLEPTSRYLEMNPGVANRPDSGLADQIALADWLILTSRYERWNEPNASVIPGSPLPNEVVSLRFCVHSEHGVWQLLRRCEPRSAKDLAGSDEQT